MKETTALVMKTNLIQDLVQTSRTDNFFPFVALRVFYQPATTVDRIFYFKREKRSCFITEVAHYMHSDCYLYRHASRSSTHRL